MLCKADYTQKLKLLYMLHQALALLENDDFAFNAVKWVLIFGWYSNKKK